MDLIYLLGLLVLLYSVACLVLVIIADCDIITFLYSRHGKKPETEYRGKIVWITGASSGIGEALAKELAKVGAKLILSARRKEELERVKRVCISISKLTDNDILVLPLDVTDFDAHAPALNHVLSHFKKLDLFISNAGVPQKSEFVDVEMHVDRAIFEVNVFSLVNMNRLVVKHFLEQGGGKIAVVSSLAGKGPAPLGSTYSASKHALHGYFNSLRMELFGKNILVTLICPGPVETPIFGKALTNKKGEVTTMKMPKGFPIMPVERCAYLSLVSICNGLNESWISKLPVIPLAYMSAYFPLFSEVFFKLVGQTMMKQMKEA